MLKAVRLGKTLILRNGVYMWCKALMEGDSICTGTREELYGMLKLSGLNMLGVKYVDRYSL
jgi:hypothetical protein